MFSVANIVFFVGELLVIAQQIPGLNPAWVPYIAFAQVVFNLFCRAFLMDDTPEYRAYRASLKAKAVKANEFETRP